MSVVDLASYRQGARIVVAALPAAGFVVRFEPPVDRPGLENRSFATFSEACRYALAIQILAPRPFVVDWAAASGGSGDGPGAAA